MQQAVREQEADLAALRMPVLLCLRLDRLHVDEDVAQLGLFPARHLIFLHRVMERKADHIRRPVDAAVIAVDRMDLFRRHEDHRDTCVLLHLRALSGPSEHGFKIRAALFPPLFSALIANRNFHHLHHPFRSHIIP